MEKLSFLTPRDLVHIPTKWEPRSRSLSVTRGLANAYLHIQCVLYCLTKVPRTSGAAEARRGTCGGGDGRLEWRVVIPLGVGYRARI